MDIAKAREVKKNFDKAIKAHALTDDDLGVISLILLSRLNQLEKTKGGTDDQNKRLQKM